MSQRRSVTLDAREAALTVAEEVLARRAEEADRRELALAAQSASEALLREANERLVVATVNAQTMTEVAEQATAQMSFMAEHDYLTGLPNRAVLIDRLSQSITRARRNGNRVGLIYVDLDHFKHINDSLGHGVGDRLLQELAMRFQTCVRSSDTVSRQGGDEFVILLGEISTSQDAALTAEKLLKVAAEPCVIDGHRIHVTLSIGISICPDDGDEIHALLMNADTAMYTAKRNGRNAWQAFTPDMNVRAVARQSMEESLHHALKHQEFVLHYQAKTDLETGAITGAEALVRMEQRGQLVPPLEFVRVAEDCGLILPLGRWVMREACRQTVEWQRSGRHLGQIAVNVSALEFHGKDFLPGVRAILKETGLAPRYLELELTEGGLIQDTATTAETLKALKALGVRIAIDDFGTGYSSLSYLRRFPIDTLKIDQSFVAEIGEDTTNPIVGAVIAMGLSLKQRVVAEGIETQTQLDFLRAHHCAEGQGYLFGKPLDARSFGALLAPRVTDTLRVRAG